MIAKYRRRLATVREGGFAVSRQRVDTRPSYAELHEAMREYASGDLTPARERAVRRTIAESSAFFETIAIEDGETYDIGAVVVPVLGPDGRVAMCIRASQLPAQVGAATVRGWIATLQEAADSVARLLRSDGREDYTAYLDTMPGDFMM